MKNILKYIIVIISFIFCLEHLLGCSENFYYVNQADIHLYKPDNKTE